MIVLLANGEKTYECNVCHGHFQLNDGHKHAELSSDVHVCVGCEPYKTQSIGFFTWFVKLESFYRQQGLKEVPRSGKYAEDWPIQYYEQGTSPEDAFHEIEEKVAHAG